MSQGIPRDFWDARFSSDGYAYGRRPSRWLMAWSDVLSKNSGSALVPACGEGRDAVFLAMLGLNVTALDFSSAGLEKTKQLAARCGVDVETVEADLTTTAFDQESYDVIVSNFVHLAEADRSQYHANLSFALKPGGFLFLEGFRRAQTQFQETHNSGGPTDPSMLFTPPMITTDFAELEEYALWTGVEHLSEGIYHTGLAAILRAVFTKTGN